MPSDNEIAARKAEITRRVQDFARGTRTALNLDDAALTAQAIRELTGLPPARPAAFSATDEDFARVYVQQTEPTDPPARSLWIPIDSSGVPASPSHWKVMA